jgi:peptidoglycan hydrolase-like protein with peptidoglycan-binding domain
VTKWQEFLKIQGYTPSEGGTFDDQTVQATVDFQRFHNLPPTGRANNMTVGMAMLHGFKILPDE